MSSENHPRPQSASVHGRLNLEQQRKRAKELLKAAKAGTPAAMARFAALRMPQADPPRLADAQWVIARENGFASWATLKHHLDALDFARRSTDSGGDRDRRTLHVRCGSDIRQKLKTAGFTGDFLEFSDPFCIGPVPRLPLDQHIRSRARFLASAFGLAEADALARLRREYAALDGLDAYERVVLWFEHDSYDQLILAYLLKRFGEQRPKGSLELITVDSIPGVARFVGIGQLAPDLLAWLWGRRVPVSDEQIELGERAWAAVTAPAAEALHQLVCQGTPPLPLMGPALARHLRELPDQQTGLGLTERLVLETLSELGTVNVGQLFGALTNREPLPYLGDLMLWSLIQPLASNRPPLLDITDDAPGTPWLQRQVRLTSLGADVMKGRAHWLDYVASPRWVGGISVTPRARPST